MTNKPSSDEMKASINRCRSRMSGNSGIEKGIEEGFEKDIEEEIDEGIEKGIEKGIEEEIDEGIDEGIEEGDDEGNDSDDDDILNLESSSEDELNDRDTPGNSHAHTTLKRKHEDEDHIEKDSAVSNAKKIRKMPENQDPSENYNKVKNNYSYLEDVIEAGRMVGTMFERYVFDLDFMEEIHVDESRKKLNSLFMTRLMTKLLHDDGTVYSAFLEALSSAECWQALDILNRDFRQ